MLGTERRPQREETVIIVGEYATTPDGHKARVPNLRKDHDSTPPSAGSHRSVRMGSVANGTFGMTRAARPTGNASLRTRTRRAGHHCGTNCLSVGILDPPEDPTGQAMPAWGRRHAARVITAAPIACSGADALP